ncbi:rhodanese-like domain-containing protein [Anaerovoracaceae bacterium Sow4_D4]
MKRSKKMFTVMLALCVALSMAMASVTANAATKKPKKIYLKATSTTVDIKGKVKVSVYKTKPSKASKSVKWKSSNKKVATVSKSGYVTGKKKGTVKITATSKKNKKAKKTIKIKVKNLKAKSVTMSKKSMSMFVTKKVALKATVKGSAGFYNQGVTWKTSNKRVATVDSKGNVVAKGVGSATITATERGGSKKATCAVKVLAAPDNVTVDKDSKTVTVDAIVGSNAVKARHTYLCYYKGTQANSSVLITGTAPEKLAKALSELSATPWNNNAKVPTEFKETGKKTIEALAADGTGNKNYTRMDVSIKYGDKTATMMETLKDAKDNDNFSMIYANTGNDANAKFGCLTCTNGCWSGVVANESRLTSKDFVSQGIPAEGTKVTVTYTVQTDNYISAENLKKAAADYVILDVRAKDDYDDAHIAGAISTPVDIKSADVDETIKNIVADKGTDKKYALICYSGNRYAQKASSDLRACNVNNDNIVTLGGDQGKKSKNGGMIAWRTAGYELDHYNYTNAATTFKKMKDSSYVILDARKTDDASRGGYIQGHIPGAVSADVDGIVNNGDSAAAAENVKTVVDKYGKDKKYIVICYSGNRYAKVATGLLMNYGIKNANIQTLGGDDSQRSDAGGMKAWNAKYPSYVVAKHTSTGKFNFANGITPEHLKADVDGQKVFTVMDVRAKDDFDKGHISNAVSAPSNDEPAIKKAVNDNPNGLYVLVCYSGNSKADEARNTMVKNGVDESRIICLQGGMGTWK